MQNWCPESVPCAVRPPNWCNSHGSLGSTCYILPQGRWPLLHWEGKEKSLPDSTVQFQFDHVLLVTRWALTLLLTQSLRNENWQTSLERAHDSALTEQHQTAEQCLCFWQLTSCCDLFPCAGAKRGLRQRGPNGAGRSYHLLPWKSHPEQFVWD